MKATRLLLVLFFASFLVACSSNAPPSRPLYTGSDGVILTFPQSNALQQFQNDTFIIATRLENDGADSIGSANPGFVIVSFDPAILTVKNVSVSSPLDASGALLVKADAAAGCTLKPTTSQSSVCKSFSARGRSQYTPIGDVVFAEFTFRSKILSDSRRLATTPVTVQACYPYTTTFIANICVDRDLSTTNPAACQGISLSAQPQGAPVAVTTVSPRYTATNGGVNARYEITLRNLKDGIIIAPGLPSTKSCNLEMVGSGDDARYGIAKVSANLSTIPLSCGFDKTGIARFVNGEAKIICYADNAQLPSTMTAGSNYEAPIIITVQYFYIQRLTAQIEVKR